MASKWDRDVKRPPTLAEQRHAASEVAPHRSRKNTRRWCRGKVGVEHAPSVRLGSTGRWVAAKGRPTCEWREKSHWTYRLISNTKVEKTWEGTGEWFWSCRHEDYCTACGKILEVSLNGVGPDRCPDYRPQ